MKNIEDHLDELIECEFVTDLYLASIAILEESDNPLHFNFFCLGIRELIRIIMNDIAPNELVSECEYCEFTDKGYPTKSSQMKYAILNGLDAEFISGDFSLQIDETCKQLNKNLGKLSKYVHLDEDRFDIAEDDIQLKKGTILTLFLNFLECMTASKNMVRDDLANHFENQVINRIVDESVDEVDELATHNLIENVYTDHVELIEFDKDKIQIQGTGSVDVELQYGSNSDFNKGDGLKANLSFPFTAIIQGNPQDIDSLYLESFNVDTSSYYE
jgi:hypothetical protein